MKHIAEIPTSAGRTPRGGKGAMSKRPLNATTPASDRGTKIRRILVPVDFSPASRYALDYAADRARDWGASIVLLHVLEPILVERRFVAPRLRTLKNEARLVKQRLLFLMRRRVGAETPVKPWLLNGEPSARIVQAAAKTGSDLIIMGSVGRKGIRRLLLGSVAENVIRKAECPVTIVRGPRPRKQKRAPLGLGTSRGERAAIVLMGSPGSGKTTLARALAERAPISIIEVGNLLQREVQRGTSLGKAMKPFTSTGNLVPWGQVTEVVSKALRKAREDIVLFDGIPRSTTQIGPFLEMLAEQGLELRAVVILTLGLQTALARLVGRLICNQCGELYNVPARSSKSLKICERCGGELVQRQDDREEIVRERFKRFEHETMPVIRFFKKEFSELTWEQSATMPEQQRIERVWRRLKKTTPHNGSRVKQKRTV
jgi:adenylate kinase